MDQNSLSNFGRGSPKEHFCEIIIKSDQQFWRKSCSKQKLTMHRRMTDKDQPQYLTLSTLCSGELKSKKNNNKKLKYQCEDKILLDIILHTTCSIPLYSPSVFSRIVTISTFS